MLYFCGGSSEISTMRYTQHTLNKIEELLKESGFVLRYERGSFQSGYCIVEGRNIIIVNRFFDTEGRINALLEIIPQLSIPEDQLEEAEMRLYREIIAESSKKTVTS